MKYLKNYKMLNKRFGTLLFVCIVLLAAFFRLYQIDSLPPGLHPSEAQWLFLARVLLADPAGFLSQLSADMGGFILSIGTYAGSLAVADSIVSLRVVNSALGVFSVIGLYLWVKDLYGRRPALLSAFILAVSPWAVTFSRNIWPINLTIALFVWLCFFATRAYRIRHAVYYVMSAALLTLGCMSSRLFWLVPLLLAFIVAVALLQKRQISGKKALAVTGASTALLISVVLVGAVVLVGNPAQGIWAQLQQLMIDGYGNGIKGLVEGGGKTLSMFFLSGDQDYSRNLGGLPMLNMFFGLMLILGLMFLVIQRSRLASIFILSAFVLTLMPGAVSPYAPDAYRVALSLPIVSLIVGLGINYLLTRWYSMFPVNTTARSLGLSFVILLIFLSSLQAYRQYFVAWAQDPTTYSSYREDLLMVSRLQGTAGTFVVVNNEDKLLLRAYKTSSDVKFGTINDLQSLSVKNKPKTVILLVDYPRLDEYKKQLEAKYPGGEYSQIDSEFNDRVLLERYIVQ